MKKIVLFLASFCAASEIAFVKQPEEIKVRDDFDHLTGDMVKDIHRMATGENPHHISNQHVFSKFNPFHTASKAVILVVPSLPQENVAQQIDGDFMAESIELAYPDDAVNAISTSSESLLVLKTDKTDSSQFIDTITKQLTDQYGENYILSLVVDSATLGENKLTVDRQILAADDVKDKYKSTEPRNGHFSVIFIISSAIVLVVLFTIVWISYEMVNMEPGDNIAYKLGAAYSKKNM